MKKICVYCGSSPGNKPAYASAARELGELMVKNNIELVYGGGNSGLMGVIADTVIGLGGIATGVIPSAFVKHGLCHRSLTKLNIVKTMHERKAKMSALADAFIALPGGLGTLEEITESLTWSQLGIHRKPCGLLNISDYYSKLINFFDLSVSEGFFSPLHRSLIISEQKPGKLLDAIIEFRPEKNIEDWSE
ncbi:MAG TPA: TIGR00730 family Rossman fold protein [Elusimicrobia bacterium]|nr:MAG: Rossman fold protein, TIGR00730 family [Elusimicrobia bacterium RIFOXYA12_FULL_49_49]OGS10198.1 MAG: Rossman fold protein, TIGR00730 family [Elusimicrobia bacterium RIFOXYA1_FULL_47_7]OGS11820.1 MAG: Rossman fold protein, TIGR00730 family [Elusimicrobia bacterium RIFOXYB1_FULL_48_9]OGS16128.1 MAG: Rossman fold protein, TIGR00730 family [Elusimicrobia bacterium RIFOXYA2_FULL_47_53]OGS26427.1 MAG: Rossman fold protein, TIGR00730 family [Elusimicrobia bacterium RIFOXYB12_FULL_50_12]OGS291